MNKVLDKNQKLCENLLLSSNNAADLQQHTDILSHQRRKTTERDLHGDAPVSRPETPLGVKSQPDEDKKSTTKYSKSNK